MWKQDTSVKRREKGASFLNRKAGCPSAGFSDNGKLKIRQRTYFSLDVEVLSSNPCQDNSVHFVLFFTNCQKL